MNADAEVDVTIRWQACISLGKRRLRLDSALNGIDSTAELCQDAVPGGIGNPTATGSNQPVKDESPVGQSPEGTDLVGPHQAAISLNVGRKNRNQPTLGIARSGQDMPSDRTDRLPRARRGEHLEFRFFVSLLRK
jgi:hypothetical protein